MVRCDCASRAMRSRSRLSFLLHSFPRIFLDSGHHTKGVHAARVDRVTSIPPSVRRAKFADGENGRRARRRELCAGRKCVCCIHLCTLIHNARCISNGKRSYYESLYATLEFVYHERIKRGESPEELSRRRYLSAAAYAIKWTSQIVRYIRVRVQI